VKDISHFEIRPDGCGAEVRPERGFTLIELMVVLVIISMFSAMIVPSIASALRKTGLKSTGNQICELLDFAYMSAVTRHRPVDVNLDAGRGLCWVSVSTVSLPWLAEQREPETRILATMELPEGTMLIVTRGEASPFSGTRSQPWEVMTFRSDGGTEDALIGLTSARGERFEIQILGATGEVHGTEVL
jgi:type II secretion system protein H